ncbi:hypothetical protein [Allochromatium vinosum]|nr:hypothetical protein [Allochromatium vinosum]
MHDQCGHRLQVASPDAVMDWDLLAFAVVAPGLERLEWRTL